MARRLLALAQLLFSTLASACCIPFSEVLIEESEQAWQEAFSAPVPTDVVLLHGQYWRGMHWSGEHSWFFSMEPNKTFFEDFVSYNRLVEQVEPDAMRQVQLDMLFAPPAWFAPPGPAYQIWRSEDIFVIRDIDQGTIFLHGGSL